MKKLLSIFILLFSSTIFAAGNPVVVMDTSEGEIVIELYPQQAPKTVANFLAYIEKDNYKQTLFHRVISGFMIQGGGYGVSGRRSDELAAVENESKNGLSNTRGTIAMARVNHPHSATRQFFINHKDNPFLDAKEHKWGYAVFGKVTSGMQVVDQIAAVKTGYKDKPNQPVIINSITLMKSATPQSE